MFGLGWFLFGLAGPFVGLVGLFFMPVCLVFWGLFGLSGLLIGAAFVLWFWFLFGEFDPGSGRTLAACLTHASRTMKLGACFWWISGERVSNT